MPCGVPIPLVNNGDKQEAKATYHSFRNHYMFNLKPIGPVISLFPYNPHPTPVPTPVPTPCWGNSPPPLLGFSIKNQNPPTFLTPCTLPSPALSRKKKEYIFIYQARMDGGTLSMKVLTDCSKNVADTLREKFLTRGNFTRLKRLPGFGAHFAS